LALLLVLWVTLALSISFLCSLLEATLLASRFPTLSEQRDSGSQGAGLLLELKQHRIDDAISAILILNTIANTAGATLAGAQAAQLFGSRGAGVFTAILTFCILVFSEIIPKTLGAAYARTLSGAVGWILTFLAWVLRPVLVLSRTLTRLLTHGGPATFSRGELAAVIDSATSHGTISGDESKMFVNLLRLNEIQVEDVMTPRTVAFMMDAGATVDALLAERQAKAFSRIPLYRDQLDNIVGYVLQRDVLLAVARDCDRTLALESFRRDITFIPELATVGAALRQVLERKEPIAMATDEHGGVSGLVTLEDLTETILGVEIVDESDRIADLRQAAAKLRDRRLERLSQQRSEP
jgi:CBS domain containing-hemolysin-like protein